MGAGKGRVIVIVGRQDTGKTTLTKKLIAQSGKPSFVFDIHNEYGRRQQTLNEFLDEACTKKNSTIVIEDATIFLSNRGDDWQVKSLLAGRSHYNNDIFILYHSLRSVPLYILDMTDYYILFKTNDNGKLVSEKFKYHNSLLADFQAVNENKDAHFHIVRKAAF